MAPSPQSLLGRYIETTGARVAVRRFPRGPGKPGLGPKKLVVPVSARSFDDFIELFSGKNFLFHVHTPQQGTLHLAFEGKYGSYGNLVAELRFPTLGTIMPMVLLTSGEGARAADFFELASQVQSAALTPWTLTSGRGEPYCATGGYSSCTHWFGNIPIGRNRVDRYTFPGKVDQHAYNSVSNDPVKDREPRTQVLRSFTTDQEPQLTKRVWTVPGHAQLADVIGLRQANLDGELANPGWVAYSLISGPSDRIPVVFVMVEDHRRPIPRELDLMINAY